MGSHIVCSQCQQPENENLDYSNLTLGSRLGLKRDTLYTRNLKKDNNNSSLSISSITVQDGIFQVFYQDGSCYKGQMLNGMRHGKGIQKLDSVQYQGMWHLDKAQGRGRLKAQNFQVEGHFYGNHLIQGKMKVCKGKQIEIYEGQFNDFKYHGKGILTIQGVSRYEGQFKNHKKQGKGKVFYQNGSCYQGQFKNGVMYGMGTFKNLNYEYGGELKENKISEKDAYKTLKHSSKMAESAQKIDKQRNRTKQTSNLEKLAEIHSFTFAKPKLRA